MFKKQMQFSCILTPGAAGVNVYNDTALHQAVVCADNTVNPLVPYLPPILHNSKNTIATQAAVAEVARVQCLNIDDEVTISTDTRYSVIIEQVDNQYESTQQEIGKYSYVTPTATLGSAALDRANLVTILAAKINAHTKNHVAAYAIQKIAFSTGNGLTTPVFGDTTIQAVTGYTGIIVKVEITSGTFLAGTAAGYLYLYTTTGTMAITSVITTAGSVVATLVPTAAGVPSQDILIIDDGVYYRDGNKGYTGAILADGFSNHTVTEIRAAVYESGNGTHMLVDVPRFDETGQKLESGNMEYFNANAQLPVAGRSYTRYEITCYRPGVIDPMTDRPGSEAETTMIIWADQVSGANLTNFYNALLAAIV